jgi:hypothetical protein
MIIVQVCDMHDRVQRGRRHQEQCCSTPYRRCSTPYTVGVVLHNIGFVLHHIGVVLHCRVSDPDPHGSALI